MAARIVANRIIFFAHYRLGSTCQEQLVWSLYLLG